MTINLAKLKALAEAAKRDPYDHVAANDFGTSMPPAMALELIAEIERHRLVEAEGCKPEISPLLPSIPCAGGAGIHNLNQAEGCKPDLSNRLIQAVTALIPYAEDEAANSYCEENADKAWAAVDFARTLLDEIDSKKSIGEEHA